MDTIFIPREEDFRRWVREAVTDAMREMEGPHNKAKDIITGEPLLSRKEVAGIFQVSLVTLHAWMHRGLPCHRQGGRVYFLRTEVMAYVMKGREKEDWGKDSLPPDKH